MSKCLTWFPFGGFRRTQYIPELGLNYNVCGFYLEVCGKGKQLMFFMGDSKMVSVLNLKRSQV